jgi:hypothetical protein
MRVISRREALALSAGAAAALPSLALGPSLAQGQEATAKLGFSEMYVPGSMAFTTRMQSLENKRVQVAGFMAPPLKPDAAFFVLTAVPMATCPYCEDAGSWPDDIVFVRTLGIVRAVEFDRRIAVTGTLELGTDLDKDTGFVSLVRLTDAYYARA